MEERASLSATSPSASLYCVCVMTRLPDIAYLSNVKPHFYTGTVRLGGYKVESAGGVK